MKQQQVKQWGVELEETPKNQPTKQSEIRTNSPNSKGQICQKVWKMSRLDLCGSKPTNINGMLTVDKINPTSNRKARWRLWLLSVHVCVCVCVCRTHICNHMYIYTYIIIYTYTHTYLSFIYWFILNACAHTHIILHMLVGWHMSWAFVESSRVPSGNLTLKV